MPWLIDHARTRVGFSVKHMLVSSVRGEFKRYRGTLQIDRDDFTRSVFAGDIELASIDTGNAERDGLLRSHAVLGEASYPLLTFQSTGVVPLAAGEYEVRGVLTLRGIARTLKLQVAHPGVSRTASNEERCTLRVRGTLSRKAFGVNFGMLEAGGLSVGDSVNIELDVQAVFEPTNQ